jgi:ectoine hydroxylase-related dioxygenase (phytanoyl-CoA dioxygenase family)
MHADAAAHAGLNALELETYHRDGLVVPAFHLPAHRHRRLQGAADRLIAARPDLRPEFIPNPHVPWNTAADTHAIAAEFFGCATDPAILDLVESVLGPDIIFWAAALFCKPPGEGREVAWHQDGVYWPIDPPETLTVWVAIDAASPENGSMQYLPGSHKIGVLPHEASEREGLVLNTAIVETAVDTSIAVSVVLEPGQVSMHHIHLVHGSPPNRSARRRAGLTLRYMPSTSHFDRARAVGAASNTAPVEFAKRPIWLVRGVDRCGRNDFSIGHW